MTKADALFCLEVARAAYPPFCEAAALAWFYEAAKNPALHMIRGERGFAVASLSTLFYDPKPKASLVFLAVKPPAGWEGYRLLRSVVEWARERGAVFHLGADTGVDFGPWARRLGGKAEEPSYIFE